MKKIKKFNLFTNESFDMYRNNCDRCKLPTGGITIMSIFNNDVICTKCKDKEKKDPEYRAALQEEQDAVARGVRNYQGALPNYKPL